MGQKDQRISYQVGWRTNRCLRLASSQRHVQVQQQILRKDWRSLRTSTGCISGISVGWQLEASGWPANHLVAHQQQSVQQRATFVDDLSKPTGSRLGGYHLGEVRSIWQALRPRSVGSIQHHLLVWLTIIRKWPTSSIVSINILQEEQSWVLSYQSSSQTVNWGDRIWFSLERWRAFAEDSRVLGTGTLRAGIRLAAVRSASSWLYFALIGTISCQLTLPLRDLCLSDFVQLLSVSLRFHFARFSDFIHQSFVLCVFCLNNWNQIDLIGCVAPRVWSDGVILWISSSIKTSHLHQTSIILSSVTFTFVFCRTVELHHHWFPSAFCFD